MRAALAITAALLAGPAAAGDLTVVVTNAAGQPVRDAVVMVKPAAGVPAAAAARLGPLVMAQKDIAFAPYVLIAPVGSSVAFPNKDKVRHHVYSFSTAKKFELKLYGKDETRSVVFDKPGPVSLGCNIHDSMIGFIYVTDTPYAAKSGADGAAVVQDVPAGGATLLVWHPNIKGRMAVPQRLTVTAAAQRTSAVIQLQAAR